MKSFTVSTRAIEAFRKKLLLWYTQEGRDLPWRKTHDPYAILVSEMMLQQTQVDRVKDRYILWLKQFPTVQDLAKAKSAVVLQAWSGLGYNRRALALHGIAQSIVEKYHGQFPNTIEELQKLKGIGRYTASAIVAFAFKRPVPIVDTNVKRVLGRIFLGYKTLAQYISKEEPFWVLKQKIVPQSKRSYDFNQAIMDFGALICTAKKPQCNICPMQTICTSYPEILTADAELLRVKKKRLEPLFFGQPRRIWRGKILSYMHDNNTHPVSLEIIGQAIQIDWVNDRLNWLKSVVETMEKDGLVQVIRKPNWLIQLPG